MGGNTNGRFAIHPTTGLITSTLDYDVDQAAMPTTDIIVVQVRCWLVLTVLVHGTGEVLLSSHGACAWYR